MLFSLAISAARDAELRAEVAHGDPARRKKAIDALLRELMPSLHALCVNTLGSGADAQDALQEALVAVYRGLASFRGEAKVSTWAYRITIRIALRHAVKRRRGAAEELEDTVAAVGDTVTAVRAREILAALAELAPKHRVVLALFAIHGLSHHEIAEILGVPEGTVWSRLHHGRLALAALLGEATGST